MNNRFETCYPSYKRLNLLTSKIWQDRVKSEKITIKIIYLGGKVLGGILGSKKRIHFSLCVEENPPYNHIHLKRGKCQSRFNPIQLISKLIKIWFRSNPNQFQIQSGTNPNQIQIQCRLDTIARCAEMILNKIAKPLNETFSRSMNMHQGYRICFVWNPRLQDIEFTC